MKTVKLHQKEHISKDDIMQAIYSPGGVWLVLPVMSASVAMIASPVVALS